MQNDHGALVNLVSSFKLKECERKIMPLVDNRPKPKRSLFGSDAVCKVTKCDHCGRQCSNFAGGFSRGYNNERLCHPNAKNRPDCYKLVTVYKHETPCKNKTCYEDHENLMDYVNKVDDNGK